MVMRNIQILVLTATLAVSSAAVAASANFANTAGGLWSTGSNWSATPVGGAGTAVNLNADFTSGAKTITLDTDATVGTMIFGDSNSAAGKWRKL